MKIDKEQQRRMRELIKTRNENIKKSKKRETRLDLITRVLQKKEEYERRKTIEAERQSRKGRSTTENGDAKQSVRGDKGADNPKVSKRGKDGGDKNSDILSKRGSDSSSSKSAKANKRVQVSDGDERALDKSGQGNLKKKIMVK